MEKIKNILNNHKCLKLICGAGNEDLKEIERLCFVYTKAGFNMVDVSAKSEVISAAYSGIIKAGKINEVAICVSIGLQDDIHLSKAVITKQKCNLCNKCINVCPQEAIYTEDDRMHVFDKKCIGCGKCIDICPNNAIIQDFKYKAPHTMLLQIISEKIDCVEFHCSSSDKNLILDAWNKIKTIYNGQLSICLNRSKMGDDEILSLLHEMVTGSNNIMLQADGKPMTGGKDDYTSNLQTVAFAELIKSANIPAFLLLSGGTNSKTTEFAKLCNVHADGVAMGSYARKLVKEYISSSEFWQNEELQNIAIHKASDLATKLLSSLNY
jgi:ferredoxin